MLFRLHQTCPAKHLQPGCWSKHNAIIRHLPSFVMQSKQRSSYHGSEPETVMSAAMNVANAASSMQPLFIRRTASITPEDGSAAKLVSCFPCWQLWMCLQIYRCTLMHSSPGMI